MATRQDIRRRIKSITSTQQITKAMKMVAAAKLVRAESELKNGRPYSDNVAKLAARFIPQTAGYEHPLLLARPIKRAALVVVSSDRGLCGGFNHAIVRAAESFIAAQQGVKVDLVTIGKKAFRYFKVRGVPIKESCPGVTENLSISGAAHIARKLVEYYVTEQIDTLSVLYSEFVTAIQQEVVTRKLLPFDLDELKRTNARFDTSTLKREGEPERDVYEFDPSLDAVIEAILLKLLSAEIYRALVESQASEFGARMTAMDNATRNAEDMIEMLTLQYHRARQADITKEITEIAGGAEALR